MTPALDVERIRRHFDFLSTGRVVTNNAASTEPPRELLELLGTLAPWYENVHRGQSTASQRMTAMFEESYDTIATWLNAPSRLRPGEVRGARDADELGARVDQAGEVAEVETTGVVVEACDPAGSATRGPSCAGTSCV